MSTATDDAYVRFVNERSPELLRLAQHLTRNRDEAQDLVQTALERGYRKWHKLDPESGDGFGYVRQILVNAHTDGLRKKMRWGRRSGHRQVDAPEVAMTDGELQQVSSLRRSPEQLALNREILRRSLAQLTDAERAAVVLRFGEDLSEADVARHLDISVGTVKSTVSRALAKMRVRDVSSQTPLVAHPLAPHHPHQNYQRPQKGGRP